MSIRNRRLFVLPAALPRLAALRQDERSIQEQAVINIVSAALWQNADNG